ncbi:MAG: hypothetical protein WCF20_01115 [Methylovirgula sp.]
MTFVQTLVQIFVLAGIVSFCVSCCGFAGTFAGAADLTRRAAPPPAIVESPCRLVPQPQANLAGEVVQFRRSWVCVSRGLYADSLPPPPPPNRPWWWW